MTEEREGEREKERVGGKHLSISSCSLWVGARLSLGSLHSLGQLLRTHILGV